MCSSDLGGHDDGGEGDVVMIVVRMVLMVMVVIVVMVVVMVMMGMVTVVLSPLTERSSSSTVVPHTLRSTVLSTAHRVSHFNPQSNTMRNVSFLCPFYGRENESSEK